MGISTPASLWSADQDICRQHFSKGRYQECVDLAADAIKKGRYGEEWPLLEARAELTLGRYSTALETVKAALKRYSWSVRLRLLGHEICLHTGDTDQAREWLGEIEKLAKWSPWRYSDVANLVALGQASLRSGADAREVLEAFFDRAKVLDPQHRAPYLASGELALLKHDLALAADIFQQAEKHSPDDAEIQFGLARAFADSEPARATTALAKTLEWNPRHADALLFQVEQFLDSEQYTIAGKTLNQVFQINPRHPQAWAYQAILAHLASRPRQAEQFRTAALRSWPDNPNIDHLIGRKLSQKYRFAEGADFQRRALELDPNFVPARLQLAQDLLRLGQEEEGWRLASSAFDSDGYDVVSYNLVELRDKLHQFQTLETEHFVIRMEAREAEIYGQRVVDLLQRAQQILCKKYGLELQGNVTVEIFPEPNDFAVRTFGMPAASGYLGVCFGRVITANSPASQAESPANWEAVLWHEFCHVVTLELTRNKLPRWLSEGISVYEELQESPTWGQRMNPRYRSMILEGELTRVSELSGAFLSPPSPLHLQFAYFESALVVEFLVQRYGFATVKLLLQDLGAGLPINVALDRRTDGLAQLEQEFAAFAALQATQLAPQADFTSHDLAPLLSDDGNALEQWLEEHPNHFTGLSLFAQRLIEDENWEHAKEVLQKLIEVYPDHTGSNNPSERLAFVHRQLKEFSEERRVLETYAAHDADAVAVYLRLLDLQQQATDWSALRETAHRLLAVNPLLSQPHRRLAQAAEELHRSDEAIRAYRSLLLLEPDDPAEIHFRLARLLHHHSRPSAKRHALMALEEAPRFRAAHHLLLEISRRETSPDAQTN